MKISVTTDAQNWMPEIPLLLPLKEPSDDGVEIEVRMSVRIRKSWLQIYNSISQSSEERYAHACMHSFISQIYMNCLISVNNYAKYHRSDGKKKNVHSSCCHDA